MAARSLGLLVLRIAAGVTLVAHGYPKIFGGPDKTTPPGILDLLGPNFQGAMDHGGPAAFAQALESMGIPEPQLAAHVSGWAEFGGGVALLLGLWTRPAALAAAVNMGVAARKAHWSNGFFGDGGYEFSGLLGAACLALAFTGPGAVSLDKLRGKA